MVMSPFITNSQCNLHPSFHLLPFVQYTLLFCLHWESTTKLFFGLYEIGAHCDQAWLSDNLWVESRMFVNVIYSMIRSLPATTYLVCPTQNCVVSTCECVSGPRCSCARDSFISRKVAPVFKFCTTNLYRVNGDEKFHAVFCFCGLPLLWENKNILHQLEYTSSKLLQVVMFCTCILQAPHSSPGQHGDCSDEVP
jgi:hypothetical protein